MRKNTSTSKIVSPIHMYEQLSRRKLLIEILDSRIHYLKMIYLRFQSLDERKGCSRGTNCGVVGEPAFLIIVQSSNEHLTNRKNKTKNVL